MKVYEIIKDHLYQRGQFRDRAKFEKFQFMNEYKFDVVVALHPHMDPDLEGMCQYIHWPIPDSKLPDPVMLHGLAQMLATFIQDGKKVLIHCNGGRNRSSLLSALVLMKLEPLMTGSSAVGWLQIRRPNALANERFVDYLENLR